MSTEAVILAQRQVETYQTYSPEFKAAIITAIENNQGNVAATAKSFNLNEDTVRYWWRNSERFREFKGASLSLADRIESLAFDNVDSMALHDLSIVSYADKARALNVLVNNMQLLRGQPTSITESIERTDVTVILQSALSDAIDVTPED